MDNQPNQSRKVMAAVFETQGRVSGPPTLLSVNAVDGSHARLYQKNGICFNKKVRF